MQVEIVLGYRCCVEIRIGGFIYIKFLHTLVIKYKELEALGLD